MTFAHGMMVRSIASWLMPGNKPDQGPGQPSAVIAGQSVPLGGFDGPAGGLLEKWWTEILLVGAMLVGAAGWMVAGIRKRKPLLLLAMAAVLGGLAWYLTKRGFILTAPIFVAAPVSLLAGIVILIRQPIGNRRP